MRPARLTRKRLDLIGSLVLAALVLRALIPAGFMPSAQQPFTMVICHAGFAAQIPSQSGDSHTGRVHYEHCLFASAALGSPSVHTTPVLASPAHSRSMVRSPAAEAAIRLVHLPESRGPPALV